MSDSRPGPLDRFIALFGDVRSGEGSPVLLMSLNVFLLLVAYCVLKTVREPLILVAGGAQLKSFASAAQALTLVAYVPVYSWLASRLSRQRFLTTVVLFFVGCVQLFFIGSRAGVPHLGTNILSFGVPGFAYAKLIGAGVAIILLREYHRLTTPMLPATLTRAPIASAEGLTV